MCKWMYIVPNVYLETQKGSYECITNLEKVGKRKFPTQNDKPKQHIPENRSMVSVMLDSRGLHTNDIVL